MNKSGQTIHCRRGSLSLPPYLSKGGGDSPVPSVINQNREEKMTSMVDMGMTISALEAHTPSIKNPGEVTFEDESSLNALGGTSLQLPIVDEHFIFLS